MLNQLVAETFGAIQADADQWRIVRLADREACGQRAVMPVISLRGEVLLYGGSDQGGIVGRCRAICQQAVYSVSAEVSSVSRL